MIVKYAYNDAPVDPKNQNVIDLYKNWLAEEVRADLVEKRSKLVNICMNLTSDYNKSSVIRANNAMLGDSVYIVGNSKRYDKRGTVGTHHYENVYYGETLSEVIDYLHSEGYVVYAVDNIPSYNPKNIWDVEFPEKSAFVYGEEQRGLQPEEIALCDDMVYINQRGSVRSMNVAQAAACIMSEYSRQYRI